MKRFLSLILVAFMTSAMLSGCLNNKDAVPAVSADTPASSALAATSSEATPKSDTPAEGVALHKNIQLMAGGKAGGITDLATRLVGNWWQPNSGSNIGVVNQEAPGVYETLRNAKADGSVVMTQHTTIAIAYVTGGIDFDPRTELTVISQLENLGDQAIIAHKDAPYNNMTELVEYVKQNPGKLSSAIQTNGTTHFMWGLITQKTGMDIKLVECSSETDKLTNVAGGFIDMGNVSLGNAKQYEEAGKIKVLGVIGPTASGNASYPQWKSVSEQGFDVVFGGSLYMFGPKDMDSAMVEAINASLKGYVEDAATIESISKLGAIPQWKNVEDSRKAFDSEVEMLLKIGNELGIAKQ